MIKSLNNFEITDDGVLTNYSGNDTTVVIPDGVKEIDRYVFFGCDFLKEISIPSSIQSIDETNFSDCKNLKFCVLDGAKYLGNSDNPYLVLVSTLPNIKELDVKQGCKLIMGKACAENCKLTRVSIPGTVKEIGFMAFYNCSSLCQLQINEGVQKIDGCAFENCNIKTLELPDSIKRIEWDAFSMVSLKKVVLPNFVTHIGNGAFTQNDIEYNEYNGGYYLGSKSSPYLCFVRPIDKNVLSVTVHSDCKIIYSDAFMRHGNLKTVVLPEGLMQIGQNAFRECDELKSVNLPKSLTLIDECAFASCKKLQDVKIPDSQITVESGAFMGCSSILSLELINAVVSDNAFSDCEGLKKVTVGSSSNLYGDYIFSGCESLSEVILPKKLKNRFTIDEFEDSQNVKIKYV